MSYIWFMKQLQKKLSREETIELIGQVEISESLIQAPAVKLPALTFNSTEQLCLALQNRDKNALEYLISDKMKSEFLKDKASFIYNYISYCNTLERKNGKLLVQIFNGACNACYCNIGMKGIAVSVNTIENNKQLWKFNLIIEQMPDGKLELEKCHSFTIKREDF